MGPTKTIIYPAARLFLSFAALASASLASQAAAQVSPAPTREEIERPALPTPVPPAPSLRVEGGIERAPCALDRPEFANIRFTPTEVVFNDLQGLTPEDLRPAFAPYLGQEQPVAIVCEIRDRAATILRDAGYIASVEVPEQRIAEGRITFQVLMAKLVAIRVRGDAGNAERMIASILEPLTRQPVFNRHDAERRLLLASDIPGYSVRLALRSAGQARGEVVGDVTVLHIPFAADANIQNLGSEELGRWGAMVRGHFFGLTGLGDRTTISAFSTLEFEEQQTLQVAHEFRVGGSGLSLGGQFTYSWAEPDLGDEDFVIKSRTSFATIEASYPFVRSEQGTMRGWLGLDIVDQEVDFNGIPLTRDKLRVAFLRLTGDFIDTNFSDRRYTNVEPRWRFAGTAEVRQGLDILDASERCIDDLDACLDDGAVPPSRIEGDPTSTVLRGAALGEFRPIPRLTFSLGARAQYSDQPLFSFEEFSAGNYTIGRGYGPGALIGDRGAGVQGEVRFGSAFPRARNSFAAEPYVFVDQAWVRNEDELIIVEGPEELTSVGGGVRAGLGDQFRLDLSVAVPLDKIVIGAEVKKPDPRVLFSLTTRLWPWSLR